jgi:AcrR family transcriptional regulator
MANKRKDSTHSIETDGRIERSKSAVLETTLALLCEGGLSGVTIDEVARRSGVAKTTIYRHWPSRSALLMNACSTLGAKPKTPDTGTPREDIKRVLFAIVEQLEKARWATAMPSVIDAAERDKELERVQIQLLDDFLEPLRAVITRAQQKGDLHDTVKPSEMIAPVAGALFYRRWFSRESINEKFIERLIEGLFQPPGNCR